MTTGSISAADLSQYILASSDSTQLQQALQTLQNSLVSADLNGELASKGYPSGPVTATVQLKNLPHAPNGTEHWSAAARGNTGDGLRLGESVGAVVATVFVL